METIMPRRVTEMPHTVVLEGSSELYVRSMSEYLDQNFPEELSSQNRVLKQIGFGLLGPKKFALHMQFAQQGQEVLSHIKTMGALMALHMRNTYCLLDPQVIDNSKETLRRDANGKSFAKEIYSIRFIFG